MCPEAVSLLEGSCLKAGALSLKSDVLHTLDSLYAFYHRQWWCYSQMYRDFKLCHALLNGVALLVVEAGMIAGSIFENTIVVSCLAAWGTVLKGWNDFKKFPINVDRCQFAYTTYVLDRAPNLRTRHPIRRGQFSGQDADFRRYHH